MITIPNTNKQFLQTNKSDILGNLYATFNCDFDMNAGNIALGKRLVLGYATADLATLTSYPVGFRYFNNGTDSSYYTIAGTSNVGYVFKAGAIDGTWAKVDTAGAPTNVDSTTSDIDTAFGEMYVSTASDGKVYYLNGSSSENQTVDESGSSSYSVLKSPDGFDKSIIQGKTHYYPYFL